MKAEMEDASVKEMDCLSIYQAFAPLGVFAKMLGCFPDRNILRGPYSRREWISFFVFPVLVLSDFVLLFLYDSKTLMETSKTFRKVGNHQFFNKISNQALCSTVQFVLMQAYFGSICRVFRNIAKFDNKMAGDVNSHTRKIAIFFILLGVGHVLYTFAHFYQLDEAATFSWMMHISITVHAFYPMVIILPLFMVVFLSEAICKRYTLITRAATEITDRLPKTFADNRTTNAVMSDSDRVNFVEIDPYLAEKLFELCGASDELYDIIASISDALGPSLSLCFLSLLFNIIAPMSYIFSEDGWERHMTNVQDNIVAMFILLCIFVITTVVLSLVRVEATKSVSGLKRVRLLSLDSDAKEHMHQLIERLSSLSISITGIRFFKVNRNLLTAIGTAITAYIIVFVQFKKWGKYYTKRAE